MTTWPGLPFVMACASSPSVVSSTTPSAGKSSGATTWRPGSAPAQVVRERRADRPSSHERREAGARLEHEPVDGRLGARRACPRPRPSPWRPRCVPSVVDDDAVDAHLRPSRSCAPPGGARRRPPARDNVVGARRSVLRFAGSFASLGRPRTPRRPGPAAGRRRARRRDGRVVELLEQLVLLVLVDGRRDPGAWARTASAPVARARARPRASGNGAFASTAGHLLLRQLVELAQRRQLREILRLNVRKNSGVVP